MNPLKPALASLGLISAASAANAAEGCENPTIAGMNQASAGLAAWVDQIIRLTTLGGVQMLPAELRDFCRQKTVMMFQKFALFPHRTVLENTTYGLNVRGVPGHEAVGLHAAARGTCTRTDQ